MIPRARKQGDSGMAGSSPPEGPWEVMRSIPRGHHLPYPGGTTSHTQGAPPPIPRGHHLPYPGGTTGLLVVLRPVQGLVTSTPFYAGEAEIH